jgi:hypothetical protein
LADKHVQFNLGHVEPAAVLGGVHELCAVADAFGLVGREGLIERAGLVSAEVIQDYGDFVRLLVT